jgi:uncharacterized membrane protein
VRPSTLLLTAAVVVSNVAGNYALSWGMKHAPANAGPIVSLFEPWVIAGIVLLISWTLMRIQLLGKADLSYVLPITAIGYVLNAAIAAALLNEQVSAQRWAGTLLIVAGAGLTAFTPPASSDQEPTR